MKLKKTKKNVGQRAGSTHGHGARKKWRKSGHKGGVGMAGSGKRGDQKKTLVIKKYGNKYFGKQGFTSRGTLRRKNMIMNVGFIDKNLDSLIKKFGVGEVLDLSSYKILGKGDLSKKINVKALQVSDSARGKIEGAGGSVSEQEQSSSSDSTNPKNSVPESKEGFVDEELSDSESEIKESGVDKGEEDVVDEDSDDK